MKRNVRYLRNVCSSLLLLSLSLGMAFARSNTASDAVKQQIEVEKVDGISDDFICGVDISSLRDVEKAGGKFFNHNGEEEDIFKILKDNGVNWVRLRVWNNPVYDKDLYSDGKVIAKKGSPYGGGNNSVDVDIELAKRAKKAGLKLLVDFHYSDSWADPAKQKMPQDWKDLSEDELNKAVKTFTKKSIKKFIKAGAKPDMVQIGNELNDGFMWPTGRIWPQKNQQVGGMDSFIRLLKSASKGVRSSQGFFSRLFGKKIKIAIHLADGGKNELYRSIFDPITKAKVDYDVIGLSFYTYWHGSADDLKANLEDLSSRYGKELVVMETSYAFTEEDGDEQGNVFQIYSDEEHGYVPSVQGQATAVRDVIAAVTSVKNGKGVFYWEPAWLPIKGAGLSATEGDTWENQAMFDYSGKALPSLAVWNLVHGRGEVTNKWGGSAKVAQSQSVPYSISEPLVVKCQIGSEPKLPASVKVVYTNDEERVASVTWESHDWSNETSPKTIKVSGNVGDSDFKVDCDVILSNDISLVTDPSFESGKLGAWKLEGSSTACYVENNKGNAHTGNWTYKYWLDSPFKSTLTRSFTNIPNGIYKYSVWAMGGGGENDMYILAKNFDGTSSVLTAKVENTGWKNWVEYSVEIPVTDNQVTIGIYIDAQSGNWGNFDDVELVKIR